MMKKTDRINGESPFLVEVVNEMLEFEGQALDKPADLATLKCPSKETPFLVEVVGELCEFDGPAIQDSTELALLQTREALVDPETKPLASSHSSDEYEDFTDSCAKN